MAAIVSATPSHFSSVLHILSERAEWNQLAQYLRTVDKSDDGSMSKQLTTCEGPNAWTPLMLSCARAPPDIIQLLLERCPESVKIADRSGTYPLHFVCSWKVGEDEHDNFELTKILEHLLEYGPQVLNMQNQWGQTPLHCAFDTDEMPSVETIRVLLGLQPGSEENLLVGFEGDENEFEGSKAVVRKFALKALATQDANSYLPLHLAAKKGAPEEILQLLVSASPIAAITSTTGGDLPIHLIQYYAEDTARGDVDRRVTREGSWHGGSDIFRLKKNKAFEIVSLGQVESLLEPLCLDPDVRLHVHSNKGVADESTPEGSSTVSSFIDPSAAINLAMRLPGSRNVNLPIHIAAEHGASIHILRSFCDQNPEGLATPQSVSKSVLASSSSSIRTGDEKFKLPELFPIESFEKGRAAIEASKAAHDVMWYEEGSGGKSIDSARLEKAKEILKSFEERSDLLFAFYPDALPSVFVESRQNVTTERQRIPFRKNPERLRRLENLIRTEASDSSTNQFSVVARRIWLWLYRGINDLDDEGPSVHFQGSIGRIVAGLSKEALLKLSFISHIANDLGIELESGSDALRNVPCMIQGQSILQYAEARDASMTMNAMLFANEKEDTNFVHTICEFLEANDALVYSTVCRSTMRTGVRLLPETKLKETGRNWNLPQKEELSGPGQSEFWQHLDSKLMLVDSTHTVFLTYYLEASGSAPTSSAGVKNLHAPFSGGLLVTSEDAGTSSDCIIEAQSQKKILHSYLSTASGCEVQLSFKVNPGRSYSLRVYGPESGGRVSVSNARVRQVIHCLDRYKRTPLQVLLANKAEYSHSPLADQIGNLVDERYGFDDISSSLLLHFALKSRVSTDVLEALITSNPSLLLETDSKGRTPLHSLFLLSDEESPSLGVVQLLLRTPGENSTRLKDRDYKVPLHLAAEIGASDAILQLLVDAYPDGCYRQTRSCDIPLHLLVRSGKATSSSIELLIRPIMDSETICSLGGSEGVNLPLHIASKYCCSYEVLERLLLAFGTAASIPMRRDGSEDELYALDIFESNHFSKCFTSQDRSPSRWSIGMESHRTLGAESMERLSENAAYDDMEEADFNLRSDLIFVHYPVTPIPHRKDKSRIRRLRNLIRQEALECSERIHVDSGAQMSTMAQLAWCFLCTFEDRENSDDNYAYDVEVIIKSLPIPAVKLLAAITNPFSSPPHLLLSDCATVKCKDLIKSRVLFVGRYVFHEDSFVIHKSDDSFVVRAQDHGAINAYEKIMSIFKKEILSDIDDLESVDNGSIMHTLSNEEDAKTHFHEFASKLGLDGDISMQDVCGRTGDRQGGTEENNPHSSELTLEAFNDFCSSHGVNHHGSRSVVIKFMKHRTQFLREKVTRARLNLSQSACFVLPVIEDYDVDRAENVDIENADEITTRSSWTLSDSKDNVFALDLQEMNSLGHDFSSFNYALVFPQGERDLHDFLVHEDVGVWEIRELAQKIGIALRELHERRVVHGNLSLSNIVKVGSDVALIDLDSATLIGKREIASILSNKVAGISQKFSSAVLPPELIEKINLSRNPDALKSYLKCWAHIRNDAFDMKSLNINDIKAISNITKDLSAQLRAMSSRAENLQVARLSLNPKLVNPLESWREIVSEALGGKSIDALPLSLSKCTSLQEFGGAWARIRSHTILWERIRPRTRSDGKYAYVVKFHDDLKRHVSEDDQLPYTAVTSSEKIDVWSFGIILFTLFSRGPLFHQTVDGDLSDYSSYKHLHGWNSSAAEHVINASITNPFAQDLLIKMLAREEDRMASIHEVLQHPFFSNTTSFAVLKNLPIVNRERNMPSEDEGSFSDIQSSPSDETTPQDPMPHGMALMHHRRFCAFSMEKLCKVVFARLDDIKVPTSFIVLPYRLSWNERTDTFEAPADVKNLLLAENIGKHLLRINLFSAKLYFWLRVKENLAETSGREFKAKIYKWIRRARTEGSVSIAKEFVKAIKCDPAYESICVEMFDEEMSISHAGSFMQDPVRAAALLINESTTALMKCFKEQFMYLIDEHRGSPSILTDSLTTAFATDGTYPIKLIEDDEELRNILLPFVNIAVMVATANDGLCGLARLLGIDAVVIPDSWKECTLGLVHTQKQFGRFSIVEFATLQGIIRKEYGTNVGNPPSLTLLQPSSQDTSDSNYELGSLESFYQRHDPLGFYAALHRIPEATDGGLVFWTHDNDDTTIRSQQEISDTMKRLEELQDEISERRKLEEEVMKLNKRLNEIKKETEEKLRRKKDKKVHIISPRMSHTILEEAAAESIEIRSISVPPQLVPSSASSDAASRLRSSPIYSVFAGKGDVSINKAGQNNARVRNSFVV